MFWYIMAIAFGSNPPPMPIPPAPIAGPFIMFWYIIAMAFGSKPPPMPPIPIPPMLPMPPIPPPIMPPWAGKRGFGALQFLTKFPDPLGCACLISTWIRYSDFTLATNGAYHLPLEFHP